MPPCFNRGDPGRRRRNDARDTGGVLPATGTILWPGTAVVRPLLIPGRQATASGKHINALLATEETENIEPSSITPGTGGALRLEALTFRYPRKNATCA
ncbi:ATP-binding protein [Salmonella enterica]|nr:ATP-binding protein [Salmonella enterica]